MIPIDNRSLRGSVVLVADIFTGRKFGWRFELVPIVRVPLKRRLRTPLLFHNMDAYRAAKLHGEIYSSYPSQIDCDSARWIPVLNRYLLPLTVVAHRH